MSHALTEKDQDTLLRNVLIHSFCPFAPYISAMAGNIQARTRASLHANLQSEIHWEMRDCLTVGFCLSHSAPLTAGLPPLASNLDKQFGEIFGVEVLVLVCNSGQLLLRWRGRSGLEARGMLCALERARPSRTLPRCLTNLPSMNTFLAPPERLFWCP